MSLTAHWPRPVMPGVWARHKPKTSTRRKRKLPKEVRAQLYQLELTLIETDREIRRIYDQYGFSKVSRQDQRRRIIAERGA